LQLHHFRNYQHLSLHVEAGSVVLTGANGAGKTNILEAISFLTPGKGLRSASLAQVQSTQSHHPAGWAISAQIRGIGGMTQIGTGVQGTSLDMSEKRIVKIDGELQKSQHVLTQFIACVWVTPAMGSMFSEGAGVRRRFFDRLVYSFDAEHASRVHAYEHVVRQRNQLLLDETSDKIWLESVESKLAGYAVAIAAARLMTLEHLRHAMAQGSGAFPYADVALVGDAEALLAEGMSALDAEGALRAMLAAARRGDTRSGRTSRGAHKTELVVCFAQKQCEAASCSTGEQKALLMSLVMAHARARAQWHGCAPVLLLDEVVAHLDVSRRKALFDELELLGAQAWMTGTDAADFSAASEHVQRFDVKDGCVCTP
jgi:DNA replication and repair protein RecF